LCDDIAVTRTGTRPDVDRGGAVLGRINTRLRLDCRKLQENLHEELSKILRRRRTTPANGQKSGASGCTRLFLTRHTGSPAPVQAAWWVLTSQLPGLCQSRQKILLKFLLRIPKPQKAFCLNSRWCLAETKCIPRLNRLWTAEWTSRHRWACRGDLNRRIPRSLTRVGCCESSARLLAVPHGAKHISLDAPYFRYPLYSFYPHHEHYQEYQTRL
jgi:hypothetical protein